MIAQSAIGQARKAIYSDAIDQIGYGSFVDSDLIESVVYSRKQDDGLELLFQHAVHLVTQRYPELKTAPENFNFIFKNPVDNDVYEAIYHHLPYLMMFASHIIMSALDRIKKMDSTAMAQFHTRSVLAFNLVEGSDRSHALSEISRMVPDSTSCSTCLSKCNVTLYNALSMLFRSEFRCSCCQRRNHFIHFSYPKVLQV